MGEFLAYKSDCAQSTTSLAPSLSPVSIQRARPLPPKKPPPRQLLYPVDRCFFGAVISIPPLPKFAELMGCSRIKTKPKFALTHPAKRGDSRTRCTTCRRKARRKPLAPPAVSPDTQRLAIRRSSMPAMGGNLPGEWAKYLNGETPTSRVRPSKEVVETPDLASESPPTPHRYAGRRYCRTSTAPPSIALPN